MSETSYYFITKKCNGCNACLEVCPQGAIKPGNPYTISEEDCNACGQCKDMCHDEAIVSMEDPYHKINREFDSFWGSGAWSIGRNSWEK